MKVKLTDQPTTLELMAEAGDVLGKMNEARKSQDWVEAQHQALELARVFRQLQVEEKTGQKLSQAASPDTFRAWLAQVRRTIA
jgi:hypothetical protein